MSRHWSAVYKSHHKLHGERHCQVHQVTMYTFILHLYALVHYLAGSQPYYRTARASQPVDKMYGHPCIHVYSHVLHIVELA